MPLTPILGNGGGHKLAPTMVDRLIASKQLAFLSCNCEGLQTLANARPEMVVIGINGRLISQSSMRK